MLKNISIRHTKGSVVYRPFFCTESKKLYLGTFKNLDDAQIALSNYRRNNIVKDKYEGKWYTRLTVLKKANYSFTKNVKSYWCQCLCGKEVSMLVDINRLNSGGKKSCGCLQQETRVNNAKKAVHKHKKYNNDTERRNAANLRLRNSYHTNPEKFRNKTALYRKNNQKKINQKFKERYTYDLAFKLSLIVRSRLTKFLKRKGVKKLGSFGKVVGCTPEQLFKHIEKQFQVGMNWHNYGNGKNKWCMDHIIPLNSAKGDYSKLLSLNHYTNLQPMWFTANSSKRDKIL
jgi:hypothetical protein